MLPAALIVLAALLAAPSGGVTRADAPCALLDPKLDRSTCTTASCLGCHDGSAARVIPPDGHPVDVPYGSPPLSPILPGELVLSHGRVTCTTCHDGASPHRHRTALAPARLCTACHVR